MALAVVSYVPLLLTHRGMLAADTKSYLYLNPGKLLSRAPYMWDPGVGLGTVTHQNIGYLFPMGPYYAFMDWLGMPDWIAQRLWMGSIIFLAGLGVRYLLRTLDWEGPGVTVATFAYALSPYLLHYMYKHSVILLPFTALGWLLAFMIRSYRYGGWRDPALFALVTLAAGGVNATSLLLVMIGPLLWLAHAVVVEREVTVRNLFAPMARIGVLTLATSLWWIAGLSAQGAYGIDILRFTETYRTVANASSAAEVVRGMGYWFFYGTDAMGPWFDSAVTMTESLPALAISYAVPLVALAAALLTRFRYRVYFVGLAIAGLVVSVGSHPFDSPSGYGGFFKAWTATASGLAFRSTPRALPLLVLSSAVFIGAGVAAAARLVPRRRTAFAVAALLLVMANLSPMFTGDMVDEFLERPDPVPDGWADVGRRLDEGDRGTRALEVPGIEFAYYRWGSTIDPVTPGLTDRDFAARELVPWGSDASADLINAIDGPMQDASFAPVAFPPLLRLLGVGDLVARNDLEYERYRTPRPRILTDWLDRSTGLGEPEGFGGTEPNRATPSNPLIDDIELAIPPDAREPSRVEVREVTGPRPIVRPVTPTSPMIVSGNGQGLVSVSEAGWLDPDRLTVYSGTVTHDPPTLDELLGDAATLVVTDTNRKAARRWGAVRDNDGYTEMDDESPHRDDPTDNRLVLFPERVGDTDVQTVTIQEGPLRVEASDYGNQLTYTPGDRAAFAVDGDPTTAWKVAAFADATDEHIELTSTDGPIEEDQVRLVQAQRFVNRWITRVRLTFDGDRSVERTLDASSRSPEGQLIDLGGDIGVDAFDSLRITVLETDPGDLPRYRGISGVGFAEIDLGGRVVTEVVRPPTDLIDAVGDDLDQHDLSYAFRRRRANPAEPVVGSEELVMRRQVELPSARRFGFSGAARINSTVADDRVDALLGMPTAAEGGWSITSSGRLSGDVASRGSKAFDGNPETAWQSDIGVGTGSWLQVQTAAPRPVIVSSMRVQNDGNHSVPSRLHFEVDGVAGESFEPTVDTESGETVLTFPPLFVTASTVRIVVDEVRRVTQPSWLTGRPDTMPVAIVDVDTAGTVTVPWPSERVPATCRADLVAVAGWPIGVALDGTVADAEAGNTINLVPCTPDATVELPAGETLVATADGRTTGVDVDRFDLASAASAPIAVTEAQVPTFDVERMSRVSERVEANDVTGPFWFVLGQSQNEGWRLRVDGEDQGPSMLVNGYANGWLVDPGDATSLQIELDWTPQRRIWIALGLSGLGLIACLVLLLPRFAGRGETATSRRRPRLAPYAISPLERFGAPVARRAAVVASVGLGVISLVLLPWWWAPAIAAATWFGLRSRWGWPALRIAALVLLAVAAAYVVVRQWRVGYVDDFDWPQHFEAVHWLTMASFVLLGAETVVEMLRGGWRRDAGFEG